MEEINADGTKIIFKDGNTLYGKKYFDVNSNDNDSYITLADSDRNPASFDVIKPGDVISGFESGSNHRTELIIGRNPVFGKITELDSEGIAIDGEYYKAQGNVLSSELSLPGRYVTAYVNYLGSIVYISEEITETNYGYITAISKNGGFSDIKVRMLVPGVLSEIIEEEENEYGGEAGKTSKIAGKNKAVEEYTVSSKVKIEGEKTDGSAEALRALIENKIVQYSLNANGEIVKFEFPTETGSDLPGDGSIEVPANKTYNSYEKTFGKTASGAFGVSDKTLTICVPSNSSGSVGADDYLVSVEMSNNRQYCVKAFGEEEETKTAKLIVIQAEMVAGSLGIINASSDIGLVVKSSTYLDENGDEAQKITMLSNGEEKTLSVSQLISNAEDFRAIKTGEVIRFSTDFSDELNAFKSLTSGKALGVSSPVGSIGALTDDETFCGYLADAKYSIVSDTLNRWTHKFYCSFEPGGETVKEFDVLKNNGPDIILYEPKYKTAEFIDVKEIDFDSDKIFIVASNGTVKTVIAIRG